MDTACVIFALLVSIPHLLCQVQGTALHYSRHTEKACRRGGGEYCSLGQIQGYVGPLDSAQQLRDALLATAYKKEVIVFAENRITDAAQSLARFRNRAGYAHVLPVLIEPRDCQRLARIFAPWRHENGPISCGTYATSDETGMRYESEFSHLRYSMGMTVWWRKWFTAARSVALGYNVMAVDSDVVVLDDWYWRVRQQPLASYNMMSQAESEGAINGGFTYVQNASPSGPVAWVLYEALHRVVRWTEDPSALTNMSSFIAKNPRFNMPIDDQMMITDLLHNTLAGRPQFLALSFLQRLDPEALTKMGIVPPEKYMSYNVRPLQEAIYPVSAELGLVVCEDLQPSFNCSRGPATSMTISTGIMQMPHSGGVWPAIHGGYPFNRTIGPRTAGYRQAFRDLGVPLPPDPEDPNTVEAARNTPSEKFGFVGLIRQGNTSFGAWLESNWFGTGRQGLWHTHLNPPRVQAVGHLHAGLPPGDFMKVVLFLASGYHDWAVAARLAGGPQRMYFANFPTRDAYDNPVHEKIMEIRRVVAYAPGVITAGMSKQDFVAVVSGLAQVAVALGAVAAWPAAPCDAEWVLSPIGQAARAAGQSPGSVPWFHFNTQFMVIPFGDTLDRLQCEWTAVTSEGCLLNTRAYDHLLHRDSGRGMLAMEFASLRQQPHSGDTFLKLNAAVDDNVTSSPHPNSSASTTQFVNLSYSRLLQVNADVLLQEQQEQEVLPVVWLSRPVGQVTGLRGTAEQVYSTWKERCRALKYYEIPERDRNSW